MSAPTAVLEDGGWIMALLDRLLGIPKKKRPTLTDEAEFQRIEKAQRELDGRLAALEGRLDRIERKVIGDDAETDQ